MAKMHAIRNSLRHNGMRQQIQDGHKSPAGPKNRLAVTHVLKTTYATAPGRLQDGHK